MKPWLLWFSTVLIASPLYAEPKRVPDVMPGLWRSQLSTPSGGAMYQCFDDYHRMWDDMSSRNSCGVLKGSFGPIRGRSRPYEIKLERRDWIDGEAYRSSVRCVTEVTPAGLPKYELGVSIFESVWRGNFSRNVTLERVINVTTRDMSSEMKLNAPVTTLVEQTIILSRLGSCPSSMQPGTACSLDPLSDGGPPLRCADVSANEIRRLEAVTGDRLPAGR
jgi:hypothetical protein